MPLSPPPANLSLPLVLVRFPQNLPRWSTYSDLATAIGLTEVRFWALRKSFFACSTIDKSRNIQRSANKEIFCSEVKAWLEGDLSPEDRNNIFGREKLPFPASYAVYQVAQRFKSDFLKSNNRKAKSQCRLNQAAAPATRAALAPAASATPTSAPAAVSNTSTTGLTPLDREDVAPAGKDGSFNPQKDTCFSVSK